MKVTIATLSISGFGQYSQSRHHDEPMLEGESHHDYDQRTWLSHCTSNEERQILIPMDAMIQCLAAAAKYRSERIQGKGMKTWSEKFRSGLAIQEDILTNQTLDSAIKASIFANLDGVRGSGKRGWRCYPNFIGWEASFSVTIIDPIITKDVFAEHVEAAGMFIGIGRWRPQNGGQNGRFRMIDLDWKENRDFKPRLKR